MSELKSGLRQLIDHLAKLEERARKLENQNFADIIANARGKLVQASDHPDIAAVEEHMRNGDDEGARVEHAHTDFGDGSGGSIERDLVRMHNPPFPAAPGPGRPGDPQFDPNRGNPDFKHPENVELNADGSPKIAPNTFAHADDRDKK